jgi:hypothetical protein
MSGIASRERTNRVDPVRWLVMMTKGFGMGAVVPDSLAGAGGPAVSMRHSTTYAVSHARAGLTRQYFNASFFVISRTDFDLPAGRLNL